MLRRRRRTPFTPATSPSPARSTESGPRRRTDILLLEAETVVAGVRLAERASPKVLIVDEPERAILVTLSRRSAILLVDEVPRTAPVDARLRFLARPFSAERLLAEIGRLLA